MGTFSTILLILGLLVGCVGGILTLIAAFRQHVGWGVACLLFSPTQLLFTILHWAEAKLGFFVSLVGTAFLIGGLVTSPDVHTFLAGLAKLDPAKFAAFHSAQTPPKENPEVALTAQIQKQRDLIETLEAKFAEEGTALTQLNKNLSDRRKALKPEDLDGINQFNLEAADYKARNTARPQAAQEIATAHTDLEKLLDQRARLQASAAAATIGKHVVMYTTSSCPACKAAKAYFAQKGVKYEEHDVQNSPEARDAFLKLGGRGVPLILVGNEKMEGFSPDRLNKLL